MKNDAMKRNIVIMAAAAVVVCAVIFGVFKFVNADDAPVDGSASNTGEGLRDGAHMLLNEGWAIDFLFLNGAGLTEHEYWDIIQAEYEAQYALLNEKIAAYCSENDVSAPQWDDTEVVFNK